MKPDSFGWPSCATGDTVSDVRRLQEQSSQFSERHVMPMSYMYAQQGKGNDGQRAELINPIMEPLTRTEMRSLAQDRTPTETHLDEGYTSDCLPMV